MNRALDGISIREEYDSDDFDYDVYPDEFDDIPCSIMEMLIGVSRRMDFELSGVEYDSDKTATYFWELLENAGLTVYDDEYFENGDEGEITEEIEKILNRINDREFDASGKGGFFPLNSPTEDQRNVEIWYQMQAYIFETYGV